MSRIASLWIAAALLCSAAALAGDELRDAGTLAPHVARDPSAPVVTEANLLESERFWPYRVAIRGRALASALPLGAEGVLIRVEEGSRVRVDFGRDGVHTVPASITNVVEACNAVRMGDEQKLAPNLALAIGPRLDGSAMGIGRVPFRDSVEKRGFLAVFADPKSGQFDAIAKSLAPLQSRAGVATVLFPQSLVNGDTFGARLAALGWKIAYVYDYLAIGYTDALVGERLPGPVVSLHTAEGRLLLQRRWAPGVVAEVEDALARSFPDAARTTAGQQASHTTR